MSRGQLRVYLGAAPGVVLGRSGYDPIQEAEAFTCPLAEPEPAPPGSLGEDPSESS